MRHKVKLYLTGGKISIRKMNNDEKLYFFRESIACSVTYCGNFQPEFEKWKNCKMTLTCKNYHSICNDCFRSMTIDDVMKYGFREPCTWSCILCRSPYNWIQVFKIPHYELRSNSFDPKYNPLNINHVLLL